MTRAANLRDASKLTKGGRTGRLRARSEEAGAIVAAYAPEARMAGRVTFKIERGSSAAGASISAGIHLRRIVASSQRE